MVYVDADNKLGGEVQLTTKQQTTVLRNLQTYTKYIIRVYAENKKGIKGAPAKVEVTTKSGGKYVKVIDLFEIWPPLISIHYS